MRIKNKNQRARPPEHTTAEGSGFRHTYIDLGNQMGGTTTNRIEGCIKHGPWGDSKAIVILKKVKLKPPFSVDLVARKRTRFASTIQNEYLTSISGTIDNSGGSYSSPMLMSLSFHTNQIRYGPYGNSDKGTPFSYDGKDGMIIGFYGRFGQYINAIGIYVIPKSLSPSLSPNSAPKNNSSSMHELCCEMSGVGMPREAGPWGAARGKPWDDGVFSHVKQVRVYLGESLKVIYGIQFEYVKRDGNSILSQMHGGTCGDKTELVDLDGEKEYLSGISGFYGPVVEFNGLEGITSITIHTNKKMYGPYGQESGEGYVYFTSSLSPGQVVGFQGRNGDFLTAIGVHMEYF
ncbi:unnamed protein product [Lactuca virosa]|uniref:Jacalin-type lectin domain-containing protein n=1 Tax=Lactuca virosa TaxID=75947 RepID=A0AAU9NY40_9ASTR|nr:unnamed protein product [Lactuca virosa]